MMHNVNKEVRDILEDKLTQYDFNDVMNSLEALDEKMSNDVMNLDFMNKSLSNLPLVIAGFPGVGKSKAQEILGEDICFDLESSNFHWQLDNDGSIIHNEDGEKLPNPQWPSNYVDTILTILVVKAAKVILISTHEEVLDTLDKIGINYIIAVPADKEEYIKRYRERGNDESFISKLKENFDKWIDSLAEREHSKVIIERYLSDFIDSITAE